MSHFELFRCDGMTDVARKPASIVQTNSDSTDTEYTPTITSISRPNYQAKCGSFLEVADTFPTVVLEKLLAADWLTIHALGKADRHYCPIHRRWRCDPGRRNERTTGMRPEEHWHEAESLLEAASTNRVYVSRESHERLCARANVHALLAAGWATMPEPVGADGGDPAESKQ